MKKRIHLNLSRHDAAILAVCLDDYWDDAFPEDMIRLDEIHKRIMNQLQPLRRLTRAQPDRVAAVTDGEDRATDARQDDDHGARHRAASAGLRMRRLVL